MPWLTPDSIPEDDTCRPLSIPADTDWLALVSGALTELTKSWNWEKSGTLTVAETVAKMQEIVDGYYETPCASCTLPEGGKVIRIGEGGKLQELDGDGNWVDATGDYSIPPPDARTGGTEPDQNCLAAKNATNTLHELYDNLSSSWTSHLSEAEALTTFTLGAIALVGFEFAPITASIVAFFAVAFTALYEALAYLGADLWDDAVEKQIVCFLLACAANDAGVVTFDWDCFLGKLNSLTNDFLLSETQLRLYLQISYLLYFIGGAGGLNLAGGTTAITDDDCSDCDHVWRGYIDISVDEWTYVPVDDPDWGFEGVYAGGWFATNAGPIDGSYATQLNIEGVLPDGNYTKIRVKCVQTLGELSPDIHSATLNVNSDPDIQTLDTGDITIEWTGDYNSMGDSLSVRVRAVSAYGNTANTDPGEFQHYRLEGEGAGDLPEGFTSY